MTSNRCPVHHRHQLALPRQCPFDLVYPRVPGEVEDPVEPEPLRAVLPAPDLVRRNVEREVLAQAGRLDLDPPFRIVGLVEREHVEPHPVPASLGDPLDRGRQVVPPAGEQPPLLDLDGELLAETIQEPVGGIPAGEVDLPPLP
jgi:hypothetical protein